ncbi:MAG: hypothetical protein WC121_07955 [Candidatus Kapaibacterium sp.]
MNTPQQRLRYFIEKYYNNPTDFSAALGVTAGSLNGYLNSTLVFKTKSTLARLSDTGINIDWYLKGEGEEVNYEKLPKQFQRNIENTMTKADDNEIQNELFNMYKGVITYIKLHIINLGEATNALTDLSKFATTFIPLALGTKIDGDSHEAIYAIGQSMENTGISPEDIIIFEVKNTIPRYDCMIVGSTNGMLIVRELVHLNEEGIVLKSASTIGKDIPTGDLDDFILFGIVKKVIKDYTHVNKSS